MAIPALDPSGILPPYVGDATDGANMSPYATTLVEVAQRFCGTDERKQIVRGLLDYRQRLHALGFTDGMQWLSGSFLEDIEAIENRAPRDVDVVTFLRLPAALSSPAAQQALLTANPELFDHGQVKAKFKVDVRLVNLDNDALNLVSVARFWFGLFSHRRNGLWKGLLQVPLTVGADDADAAALVAP